MNKLYNRLVIVLILVATSLQGYGNNFKEEKWIYLWDVTLSMKGYNGAPNIYDEVKDKLISSINSIESQSADIVVIPFQAGPLEVWQYTSSASDRKILTGLINKYNNDKVTNTDICKTWDAVIANYIDSGKWNNLILLTDGEDNVQGVAAVCRRIAEWCRVASQSGAYCYYFMLTEQARNSQIEQAIKQSCRIKGVFSSVEIDNARYMPAYDRISKNIKELEVDPVINLEFSRSAGSKQLTQLNLSLSNNDWFELENTDIACTDGRAALRLRSKMSFEEMIGSTPESFPLSLYVSTDDPEIDIAPEQIIINIINKPEKVLTIIEVGESTSSSLIDFGVADYYKPFLFCKKELMPLETVLIPEFNDAALSHNGYVEFKLLDKSGETFGKDLFTLSLNGEPCADNIVPMSYLQNGERLTLSVMFNPDKGSKTYKGNLTVVQTNLDRIGDTEIQQGDRITYIFNVHFRFNKQINPLLLGLLLFIALVVALLLIWFLLLKEMYYPRFKGVSVNITDPYYKLVKLRGARMLVFCDRARSQGWFECTFKGRIIYDVHPVWNTPVEILPTNKKDVIKVKSNQNYYFESSRMQRYQNYTLVNNTTNDKINLNIQ